MTNPAWVGSSSFWSGTTGGVDGGGSGGAGAAVPASAITETASLKVMTSEERTKLAGLPADFAEAVMDLVAASVLPGSGISVAYDDALGRFTITNSGGAGGGGASEAWKTIAVAGQASVVAENAADTLTLEAGANIEITTNEAADAVTISFVGPLPAHTHDDRYYTEAEANTLLGAKAPLASPAFSGTPTAPTAAPGTNTTQLATMAAVKAARDALVGAAPASLDDLGKIASALGNDPALAATLNAAIGGKQAGHANLAALSGVTGAADRVPYFTGAGAMALGTLTAYGRSLTAAVDGAAARAALALATVANTGAYADLSGRPALAALALLATIGTAQIDAKAVTYPKIQDVSATDRVLGRSSAGAGSIEEIAFTAAARTFAAATDSTGQRNAIGLGSVPNVDARLRAQHTGTQGPETIDGLAEFVRDTVAGFVVAGTGVTKVHDDDGDTLTLASTAAGGGGSVLEELFIPIETAGVFTYPIVYNALYASDIDEVFFRCTSGSCTAAVKIDGVTITGLGSLLCNTTRKNTLATGAKRLNVGSDMELVVSVATSCKFARFMFRRTRVAA